MTIATFANQTSNLSALGAAMGTFNRILKVSNSNNSKEADREEDSASFLQSQRRRIATVEEDLLQATEFILPNSSSASTVTELAELCRLFQEGNRKKIEIIRQRLQAMGATSLQQEESISPDAPTPSGSVFWSIGGPLERVVEGDVETEGATTPGSMMQPSPFPSNRKTSVSPATPTMDSISLSASTASLLQSITPNRTLRTSQSPHGRKSRRSSSFYQSNFDGFQEEDDMITLDTHLSMATNRRVSGHGASEPMEQNEFLSKMESMLDRVEESILESRPSDEVTVQTRKTPNTEPRDDKTDEDDEYSGEDDSTDVVATQVASTTRRRRMSMNEQDGAETLRQFRSVRTSPAEAQASVRPTHILVDTEAPSPAHTNITMDATMLNDTMISVSLFPDDDNNSTVTPILDRYRLDPDDNSTGIKVVPNKRRGSNKFQKHIITEVVPEEQTPVSVGGSFYTQENGFTSPRGLPGTVSARKKKQYRKTPLPKKRLNGDYSVETLDENDDPNIQFANSSTQKQYAPSSTMGSFTVPPLRPSSFEPKRQTMADSSTRAPHTRAASLPGARSISCIPLSGKSLKNDDPAQIDENTIGSKSSCGDRFEHESVRMTKWMEHVTMAEFDIAPRIVQVQVRRDEANEAIDLLEKYLTAHLQQGSSRSLEFSEQQGYRILGQSFQTKQKCKSLLMSLCHFRRLLMYREDEMRFVVNQFSA
eukprot:scaffold7344_cov145-Cylindrotheca_fusiformis.AAC.12